MGKPAAFFGSLHVYPQVTGLVPHVGPAIGMAVTVLVGGNNMSIYVGSPDKVVMASTTVMAQGKPMVRMGDLCGHGGKIVLGMPTIIVGD